MISLRYHSQLLASLLTVAHLLNLGRAVVTNAQIGQNTLVAEDLFAEVEAQILLNQHVLELKVSNINVKVYNGVVLIAGQVPSEDARETAGKVATQHRGVARVINQLEIAGKATIISEINDLTISTQVKALVLKDLGRNVYQRTLITTENSIVYVMGFATKTEAAALENVVSSVRGVKRIVRVFEYID